MNKIIKFIIIATVFLVPLFYLPFTQSPFQFNKEVLLLVAMLVAGALWLFQSVKRRKIEFIHSYLDIPVLLIALAYLFSTIVSTDVSESILNIKGAGLPSFV